MKRFRCIQQAEFLLLDDSKVLSVKLKNTITGKTFEITRDEFMYRFEEIDE